MRYKKIKLMLVFLSVFLVVGLVSSVSARSFYVEPRDRFPISSTTFISFDDDISLSTLYKNDRVWIFGDYSFHVFSANMTINNFFLNNILEFTVTRSAGSSVSTIYVDDLGEPSSVVGSASWSFDDVTAILTINVDHASAQVVDVYWDILGGDVASRGEILAAAVVASFILIGAVILFLIASRRR